MTKKRFGYLRPRKGSLVKREITQQHWWHCEAANKNAYSSRRDARHAAKQRGAKLITYRCPLNPDPEHWHVGHPDPEARDYFRRSA